MEYIYHAKTLIVGQAKDQSSLSFIHAVITNTNITGRAKLRRENGRLVPGQHAFGSSFPEMTIEDGRYTVRFARTSQEVDAALRLRYEVFNLELGEGLESSHITGRDEDRFDSVCHHLIVQEQLTGKTVGTYRLQTLEMAKIASEFYCAGEFMIEDLPHSVLAESLEIGRACISLDHRNSKVLFLLWKGLGAYAAAHRKRFLFGCCSLTSQDSSEGWKAARRIEQDGFVHDELIVKPRKAFTCEKEPWSKSAEDSVWQLPKPFLTYLRFGAKVCSEPAIDREFKTIDFFVIFDLEMLDDKHRRLFFE